MSDDAERRRRALTVLDAARPYLEHVTPREFAQELITQALDILPRSHWPDVIRAAKRQIPNPHAADAAPRAAGKG